MNIVLKGQRKIECGNENKRKKNAKKEIGTKYGDFKLQYVMKQ